MRKIILPALLAFYLFSTLQVTAQQLPMYSQYLWNDYIINPAYTGSQDVSPVQATYRKQWMGFNGSPETYTFGGHTSISKSVGLGGMIFKDASGGAYSQTGALLNYAYRLQLDKNSNLAFGLSAELNEYSFNAKEIKTLDNTDPSFQNANENSFAPDASFGILYQQNQKLKIGISAHQLLQSKLKKMSLYALEPNRLVRHYNLLASYSFMLNNRITVEPSLLLKATEVTPIQMELGTRLEWNQLLWFGVSYRHKDAVVLLFGVEYGTLFLGYSYDATLSSIRKYSTGSSEIVLACKFGRKRKNETFSFKEHGTKLPLWYVKKLKRQDK